MWTEFGSAGNDHVLGEIAGRRCCGDRFESIGLFDGGGVSDSGDAVVGERSADGGEVGRAARHMVRERVVEADQPAGEDAMAIAFQAGDIASRVDAGPGDRGMLRIHKAPLRCCTRTGRWLTAASRWLWSMSPATLSW